MKILIITILLLLSTTTFGQGFAKIKVIDSVNRTDEIIIGNEGLIGVDSALGEMNLFNTPIDTLEIRTIQRPNMTCLFNYDQNIDLKIDQRPVCGTLPMYSNFIIDVFANDYPVYVILTEEENFECCVTEYYLVDTMNCSYHPESGYDPSPGDTLFILDGIKPNRFVFYPEVCVSTVDVMKSDLIIFPNPTDDKITIPLTDIKLKIKSIEIFDLKGKLIHNYITSNDNEFSYIFPNKGVYLVSVKTEKEIITKKVIVQ